MLHNPLQPILRPILQPVVGSVFPSGGAAAPAPPLTNLAAWYRKGLGITDVANAVSAWADQSGNARNLLQASGAAQPTKQGDGTILFNGTGHFMATATFPLTQPTTIYLLAKQITWTIGDHLYDGFTTNSGAVQQAAITPNLRGNITGGATFATNSDMVLDTYLVLQVVFDGASSLIQVGAATATTGTAPPGDMNGFTLGATAAPNGFSNIQVKEALLYQGAHDATQRGLVRTYLATVA